MPHDVDQRLRVIAATQHGVVSVSQARKTGLSNDDVGTRVRRGQFRRLWRGVLLVDAELYEETPWLSRIQAALLLHGPGAVAGLGTAARLLGVAGADTPLDVIDVILPNGLARHQVAGIQLHFWPVAHGQIASVGQIRCTDAVRTMADLVPRLPRNGAVAALDSALNLGLLVPNDLLAARQIAAGRPGCAIASGWWELADGRAQSPLESWVRLNCHDAGLRPDALQWPVHDHFGALVGIGDLAWVEGRSRPLVAEADGADPHSRPTAVFKDRLRGNNFVGASVDTIRLTWADARNPRRCAVIVRQALATEPADLRRRS